MLRAGRVLVRTGTRFSEGPRKGLGRRHIQVQALPKLFWFSSPSEPERGSDTTPTIYIYIYIYANTVIYIYIYVYIYIYIYTHILLMLYCQPASPAISSPPAAAPTAHWSARRLTLCIYMYMCMYMNMYMYMYTYMYIYIYIHMYSNYKLYYTILYYTILYYTVLDAAQQRF